jgi:small-conductance mechanosensitive channel
MRLKKQLSERIYQKTTKYDPGESSNLNRRFKKRKPGRRKKAAVVKGAESRLKNFRQASVLAVAVTGFMLLLLNPSEQSYSQESAEADTVILVEESNDSLTRDGEEVVPDQEKATDEAIDALQNLWSNFVYNYPKILIALGCLVLAWLLTRLLRFILSKTLRRLSSKTGVITLTTIFIWLLAIGIAFSVVAGDIRALVGSFGLIGLALSWALQTPIESFTGWLLNSFQHYYRVGDRIRVGEVFGDVYKIDFLSTTVWEIGSPFQPGFVNAEQPTGRMVTFPNNEILTGTVTNLTGDFPFVWDELVVAIANESDISLAMRVLEKTGADVLGDYMQQPAREYAGILKRADLPENVAEKPQVYLAVSDSWTELTIRYLVGTRERRKWKSELMLRITDELKKEEYLNKIISVYPRQQVQFIDPQGLPQEFNRE